MAMIRASRGLQAPKRMLRTDSRCAASGKVMRCGLVAMLLWSAVSPVAAAPKAGELLGRALEQGAASDYYPAAERVSLVPGEPGIARAEAGGQALGHLFVNTDFADATGYSGKPIHVLIALDGSGVIRGVRLLEHHEPIVLAGISEASIIEFMQHLVGLDLAEQQADSDAVRSVDAVSGATVTARVIDDSVVRAALVAAHRLGLVAGGEAAAPAGPARTVDTGTADTRTWDELLADQSVVSLELNVAAVSQAFADADLPAAAGRPEADDPNASFIELYSAPASVPTIGLSLLGEAEYANLQKAIGPDRQAILVMSRGLYSFKGSGYVRGGIFDRLELSQRDQVIRFFDYHHKRLRQVAAAGAPDFVEVDLFYLPEAAQFDVADRWSLNLLVGRAIGPTEKSFVAFALPYQLPERYLLAPPPATGPVLELDQPPSPPPGATRDLALWQQLWLEKLPEIIGLSLLLLILTMAFFFQNWIAARPRLLYWGRIVFLSCTFFGLGLYASAQLSVVNILTVFNALASNTGWAYFLLEPLIFILWGGVLIALLFWGRGAYCGWLCPFGALQELLGKLAQALKFPQFRLPWGMHERLWALKYVIFLVLFFTSLHSLVWAQRLAEIEPFKTVVILKFARDWPYVVFALLMLLPCLFMERFYCRYLCPLGAALAIPARMRIFSWLKRYQQCGNPCQICANNCMIDAIHPEGNINVSECHYCMHCQQLYHDEQVCPVMVTKRKKRERREHLAAASKAARQGIIPIHPEPPLAGPPPASG